MEKITDIQDELKQMSPLLSGLTQSNLYTIPQGYFEQLPEKLLAVARNSGIVEDSNQQQSDIPEGYFNTLADTILNRIKLQEGQSEHESEEALSPLLQSIRKINPYQIPVGYFETLSLEINPGLSDTAAEELKKFSTVLSVIQHKNVFEVPDGYFNSLSDVIISKLNIQPAKIVSIGRRRNIFKYAVAAAITGIIIFTGIKIIPSRPGGDIKPTTASLTEIQKLGVDLSKDSVKMEAEYANISDADIVKYLQSNGEDVNAALVASMGDEKNLPSSEDYLLDDKTLDNFLNNIEDKDLKN
ncbi:MAG: hypothetical protein ABJA78_01400 [Ferruginibacter sp.]